MQKSLTDILNSAAPPILSRDELAGHIFRGVIQARAYFDEALQDSALSTAEITVEPSSAAVSFYVEHIRNQVHELCADDKTADLLTRAWQLDEDALDEACALIVHTFLPEKIMDRETVLKAANTPHGSGEHSVVSAQSTRMKRYLDTKAAEYIKIYDRMNAGPVFGLANCLDERAEMDLYMVRILKDALLHGINNNNDKPDAPAPDPSQG